MNNKKIDDASYQDSFPDVAFKVEITLSGNVHSWEQIADQSHENGQIVCYDLGDVEITKGSH